MMSIPRPNPGTGVNKQFPPKPSPPRQFIPSYDIADKAAGYVDDYDANGDGSINVTDFDSETTRTENDNLYWKLARMNGGDDEYRHYDRRPHERTYSIERLARLADLLGDGNGQATAAEIERVMGEYDTGDAYTKPSGATADDGQLEGHEWWTFNGDLGEERVNKFPIWYIDHVANGLKSVKKALVKSDLDVGGLGKAVAKPGEKASPQASTPTR